MKPLSQLPERFILANETITEHRSFNKMLRGKMNESNYFSFISIVFSWPPYDPQHARFKTHFKDFTFVLFFLVYPQLET